MIRRVYDELWNEWNLDLAEEIVSATVRFRGLLAVEDRVVARMTWTGTHRGPLADIEPTGARVTYAGAAFFRLADGVIEEAWVVGDTQELWRALSG